jgi:hypothetical protein
MSEHNRHILVLIAFIFFLGYMLKKHFTVYGLTPVPPVYNPMAQPTPPYHT